MTRERRRRIIHTRRTATGLTLAGTISFLAGMTDATGLALTGDFVSFMTGNTTRAALSLGEGNLRHAAILLSAIMVFVLGNAVGIVIAHFSDRRTFAVLSCVSIALATASLMMGESMEMPRFYLIVASMGMVNAAVEQIEGLPIGLTYVTGALSRFGRGLGRWIIGDRQMDWTIQIVPWAGMLAGAIVGALLTQIAGAAALWLIAVFAMLVALATLLIPKRTQSRFNAAPRSSARMKSRSQ
ncbi:hypothetical protein ATY81_22700 [Rhizobium sp. R72]|uniref:YoaK family protein n=1 Tax=unclassified Rhizobium TaxID=2613769 RepID=UPI000B52FD91|nr:MULTISPECIES: YoaK family protein [unclassified Rhizobium]OWW02089.1 hypothetical protein ATY81_22700 [Rhizobium sp. R72]OWW02207.1 hypothetical protein ATY80_22700 [Rhizobium sp. R711]